jgi:hypothetical protein
MFSPINFPYGSCLLPSGPKNRDYPTSQTFGNGIDYKDCVPNLIKTPDVIGAENTSTVLSLDSFFLNSGGTPQQKMYAPPDLQISQPEPPTINYYINLASQSLHVAPDMIMNLFFSDENVNHLRNTIVQKVKEITADSKVGGSSEGITIKPPHMDDLFYYMVNIFQTYKINNGSICFIQMKNNSDVSKELTKLNTTLLQDYVSKMVSQINMYIYYYIDASQIPEQLSLPVYTSMRSNNKSLEYNTGFNSGNSLSMASYDQVGNLVSRNNFLPSTAQNQQ